MTSRVGSLIYVRGMRGPRAEKWPGDLPFNRHRPQTLAEHALTVEEFHLSIRELMKRYPPPVIKEDNSMIEVVRHSPLTYLATPYTRYPDGIEQAFIDAAKLAAKLVQSGIKVYSPIVHCHPIAIHGELDPLDADTWIAFDKSMMHAAHVLIVGMLKGWQESRGVTHEIDFFQAANKPIFCCRPDTLTMWKADFTDRSTFRLLSYIESAGAQA